MDKIIISGLAVKGIVGILPKERRKPQRIVLDIELFADTRKAAESGDIKDTVDYHVVCRAVQRLIATNKYALLETLAEDAAKMILREFAVGKVCIAAKKPDIIKEAAYVGVAIERQRAL